MPCDVPVKNSSWIPRRTFGWCLPCPCTSPCVSACFLQREKHKLNPNRNQQINVRKVRTRKEEWERRKMGIEFMSDGKTLEQAGSTKEDRVPRGFVVLLSWIARLGLPTASAVMRRRSPLLTLCPVTRPGARCLLLTPCAAVTFTSPCAPSPGPRWRFSELCQLIHGLFLPSFTRSCAKKKAFPYSPTFFL